jgi:hypothetical protein
MNEYYLVLTQYLLADIAQSLGIDLSRDQDTLEQRVRAEGISFLTKSLPRLGKDLDSYLSTGRVPTFAGFGLRKDGIPKFLGGLIELVYPTVRSVLALQHLRQLTGLFYKLKLPFDDHQLKTFSRKFVELDSSLPEVIDRSDPVLDTASDIIASVLSRFDKENILPKHGPGSVAEGIPLCCKMENLHFVDTAETEFPFFEWCVPSLTAACDNYHNLQTRVQSAHGTAKVLFVPKDSRGPRVISCEPTTLQYLQQGIMAELVSVMEAHPLTRGRVNFRDQSINQRWARYGSIGGQWVTLDMKDASDRVSLALVERLFSKTHVLPLLLATRSRDTRLPDGSCLRMKKFAPMGSAVCFPVEALCFFALAVSVLVHHMDYGSDAPSQIRMGCKSLKGPTTRTRTVKRDWTSRCEAAAQTVKVYGDDIICASQDYEALLQYFPTVGLMFNEGKCCITGGFRESCGLDVFNGIDVTPVRIRTLLSSFKSDSNALASWCAYQRALWERGYINVAEGIGKLIRHEVFVPILDRKADVEFYYILGFSTEFGQYRRYNADLQRLEISALCPKPVKQVIALTGLSRLHWFFTGSVFSVSTTNEMLFPVRLRVSHKRRWCGIPHGV